MLPIAFVLLLLAVPRPGSTAAIDVSVATLWRAPGLARRIDAPALTNPKLNPIPTALSTWNRAEAT